MARILIPKTHLPLVSNYLGCCTLCSHVPAAGLGQSDRPSPHRRFKFGAMGLLPELRSGFMDVHVLGTGRAGTPRALYVRVDEEHAYVFNGGEGVIRATLEHRLSWKPVKALMVTHHAWHNIGGVLGAVGVTSMMRSGGKTQLSILAPAQTAALFTFPDRQFSKTPGNLLLRYFGKHEEYRDEKLIIRQVTIYPDADPDADKVVDGEDWRKEEGLSLVFICEPRMPKPEIEVQKVWKLGLSRDDIKALLAGQTVVTGHSRTITIDDILHTTRRRMPPFIVLECPGERYLKPLFADASLERLRLSSDMDVKPNLVVHLTPREIFARPDYKQWISGFGNDVTHVVVNEAGLVEESRDIIITNSYLNTIDDELFPTLHSTLSRLQLDRTHLALRNIALANSNLMLLFKQGARNLDLCNVCKRSPPRKTFWPHRLLSFPALKEKLEDYKGKVFNLQRKEIGKRDAPQKADTRFLSDAYPEVVFLGTSSSFPSESRNSSAVLVHLQAGACVLLDCGEGTWLQLCRLYGEAGAENVLRGLKAIFISHLHADHHMGCVKLLQKRHEVLARDGASSAASHAATSATAATATAATATGVEPLPLIVSSAYETWLGTCLQCHGIPVKGLYRLFEVENVSNCSEIAELVGVQKLETVAVPHDQYAHGVAMTLASGYKLAYTGDTTPSKHFKEIGYECNMVIHEATYNDEDGQHAYDSRHSTGVQAIRVGKTMGARLIVLTHFSRKYGWMPKVESKFKLDNVAYAFDFMTIRPRDRKRLLLLLPTMRELKEASTHSLFQVDSKNTY